jgi:NAD(P)H-hydrate epimerase
MESWLEPVYDAEGMRAADRWAIDDERVPSLDLMEAAGAAVAEAVWDVAGAGRGRVVCGRGNTGGAGVVAARRLIDTGYEVEVLLLWPAADLSGDAAANLKRLPVDPREVGGAEVEAALEGSGAVVDAIFGTGFEGSPRDPAEAAIEAINGCDAPVVAADIASGVASATGEAAGAAVRADVTVSFHRPKLGHWIAPGKLHTGDLRVVPIGIPDGAPVQPAGGLIGDGVLGLAPERGPESTKFTSGQVLVVGGSRGLTGAVCMCAEAAIRAGAGYATVAVPADLEPIFETKLTEVMSVGCPGPAGRLGPAASDEIMAAAERAAAVVLGPGLGREADSFELVRSLAARIDAPLVVDADGLNSMAWGLEPVQGRSSPTVLTPHAGELGRLLDRDSSEISARRLESAREAARRTGAIVVLKGDDTVVARPDGPVAICAVSSPALATAGTGDVLAGMTAALLARKMEPFAAVCAAVHAHARAGRAAAAAIGAAESVIAADVIAAIPAGLRAGGPD